MQRERTANRCHELGREHFASLIVYWLQKSNLSLRNFCLIANWAVRENWLSSGILSHITSGRDRKVSMRCIHAFSVVNELFWLWSLEDKNAARDRFGNPEDASISKFMLDNAIWLPRPSREFLPMEIGDFAEVLCGKIELSYIGVHLSPKEGTYMSEEIREILKKATAEMSNEEAIKKLTTLYPVKEERRKSIIKKLMLDSFELSTEEMEAELPWLAQVVGNMRGLRDYSAAELRADLLTRRIRP